MPALELPPEGRSLLPIYGKSSTSQWRAMWRELECPFISLEAEPKLPIALEGSNTRDFNGKSLFLRFTAEFMLTRVKMPQS